MVNPGQTGKKEKLTARSLKNGPHTSRVEQVFPTLAKFSLESPNVCNNGSNVTRMA